MVRFDNPGYVATRKSAYETELLKNYIQEFPEAEVAKDQLEYADSELSTYQNGNVQKILNDLIQAALNGEMNPEEALKESASRRRQSVGEVSKVVVMGRRWQSGQSLLHSLQINGGHVLKVEESCRASRRIVERQKIRLLS